MKIIISTQILDYRLVTNEVDRNNNDNDRLYRIDVCILGSNYSIKKIGTPLR